MCVLLLQTDWVTVIEFWEIDGYFDYCTHTLQAAAVSIHMFICIIFRLTRFFLLKVRPASQPASGERRGVYCTHNKCTYGRTLLAMDVWQTSNLPTWLLRVL